MSRREGTTCIEIDIHFQMGNSKGIHIQLNNGELLLKIQGLLGFEMPPEMIKNKNKIHW